MRTLIAIAAVSVIFILSFALHQPKSIRTISRAWSRTLHNVTTGRVPYQAPLLNCDDPLRDPDYYMVCLMPGYTLEQHKQTVSEVDFDSVIEFVFSIPQQVIYSAKLEDETLDAIRADIRVDLVECDRALPPQNHLDTSQG